MKQIPAQLNKIFGVVIVVFYVVLAGVAAHWWNIVLGTPTTSTSTNTLTMFLFILTILAICSNVAWALGMLLSPHCFKDLAGLSCISGLMMLTIFSKYIHVENDFGNSKLLKAYQSLAIICGLLSMFLGVLYLMLRPAFVVDDTDKTGYRRASLSVEPQPVQPPPIDLNPPQPPV